MIAKAGTTGKPKPKPDTAPEKTKKKRRGAFSASLGLLLGLCGLMGTRLGHLWAAFDVFSQFTVQFAFLTAAFALAMVLPRFKVLAAIVIFASLLAAYGAWPHLVSGDGKPPVVEVAANERALRVASYNTYRPNLDFDAQVASVRKLDADVVVLLELDETKRPILDRLKDTYPFQHSCFELQYCYLTIISKTPLSNVSALAIWEGPPHTRAMLGPEFGNVTIIGVHTTRFPHSRAQLTQVRALVKAMEVIPGPVIVAGDFNTTPFSRVASTLANGAGLVRHTKLPSWPSQLQLPQLAIDHIFTSPTIRAVSSQVIGDSAGSDHFPIAMTFAVPRK